jgi:hypothetical protein
VAAGILRGLSFVLYLTPMGTCTLNRNYVMNYVDGTQCKEPNSLYYMEECAFNISMCRMVFHFTCSFY